MPILLNVRELEPGMVLARNLTNGFTVLLPHNHTITNTDVSSLIQKFPQKMALIADPLLDAVVDFDDDTAAREISREVHRNITTLTNKASNIVRSGVTLSAQNVAGMQGTIEQMIQYLQENPTMTGIIGQCDHWCNYLQEHCANVFYLSMLVGNTMRNYVKQERERLSAAKTVANGMNLMPLALAAMLHDIGMTPIENLYQKKEPLTPQEIRLIKDHPKSGAGMLPQTIDPMVKLVILCHHENQSGGGYPQGLQGDQINIFARIIRIADAYCAVVADKVYQKAQSPPRALYEMLHGRYRSFYDPVVLKVFASIMQPFPLGAKLKLKNGLWAVVVRHNVANPFRPEIIVAFDELGDPLSEEQLIGPSALGSSEPFEAASFGDEDLTFLTDCPDGTTPDDLPDHPSRTGCDMLQLAFP